MATAVSAPVISSITFDQASYNTGATMTATVDYTAGVSSSPSVETFTGTATDSVTSQVGTLAVTFTVVTDSNDPTAVTGADTGAHVWTKASDTGSVAVFTAVA